MPPGNIAQRESKHQSESHAGSDSTRPSGPIQPEQTPAPAGRACGPLPP